MSNYEFILGIITVAILAVAIVQALQIMKLHDRIDQLRNGQREWKASLEVTRANCSYYLDKWVDISKELAQIKEDLEAARQIPLELAKRRLAIFDLSDEKRGLHFECGYVQSFKPIGVGNSICSAVVDAKTQLDREDALELAIKAAGGRP